MKVIKTTKLEKANEDISIEVHIQKLHMLCRDSDLLEPIHYNKVCELIHKEVWQEIKNKIQEGVT